MTVTIKIPAVWKPFVGGTSHVHCNATTVCDALCELIKQFPQLTSQLFNDKQEVNETLILFVNQEHIRFRGGLSAPLSDGDEIYIVPMITGG